MTSAVDTTPMVIHVGAAQASGFIVAGYPDTIAGQSQEFIVSAVDADGARDFGYSGTISFSSSDVLAGLPEIYTFTAGDQGMHAFTATFITAGVHSLTATDLVSGDITGTELGISISPAPASHLAFQVQPSFVAAGTAINPAVLVQLLDPFGNLVTDDDSLPVTLSIGSGPGPFTSGSTTTVTPSGGVATFSNLVLIVGGTYTLKSAATGLTGSTSSSFLIGPDAGTQLSFTAQPTPGTAGVVLSSVVKVSVLDQFGNLLVDDNLDRVTLSIASGPGGFASGTTKTVSARGGIATFNQLIFDTAGTYKLTATTTDGLTGSVQIVS